MNEPNVSVCFSMGWLARTLCRLHNRLNIDDYYVMRVYTHAVEQLESTLSAGKQTSMATAISLALETIECPYMILEGLPGEDAG